MALDFDDIQSATYDARRDDLDSLEKALENAEGCECVGDLITNLEEAQEYLSILTKEVKALLKEAKHLKKKGEQDGE